ncbi:MAG: tetratricopeptide repeat protein, partial [Flavobacterium sp.]|nr:tetratricopeptide repeat protein [Flavobacterium sp.]
MKKVLFLTQMICSNLLYSQTDIKTFEANLAKMKNDTAKVNYCQKIAKTFAAKDSTTTLFYLRKSLELAQKIHWNDGTAQSYFRIGETYLDFYNRSKAQSNFQLALSKTKNPKIRAAIYFSIGDVYLEESNYTKALANYHQSLQLFEATKDKIGLIKVLISIGSLYTGFGKNKEALDSYNRALKVSQTANNFKEEIILRGIGTVYYNYGDNLKSLVYLNKSLALIRVKKDANLESRLLSDIALVFLEMKDYQKAIDYSQASLKTDPSILSKKHNTSFSYGVIGDSYIELAKEQNGNKKQIDSAVFYLEKAAKLHRELNSLRGLYDDYESIYEAQKLKGNYAKALEYFELCTTYKDSMYNSDNKETIKNLEDKRAIELRDREIKINNLKLEAKEKQKWYFIFGLGLLGIIGGLLFYQNQNRKKTNEKLQVLNTDLDEKNQALDQANKTNARFFGILNHDLRSPVYNLIHFLHLQKENPELLDEEMKTSIQTKTMTSAENLLQSMEDLLLWSKSQMENFQPQPQKFEIGTLFEDTKKHFSSVENVQFQFENPNNLSV